MLIKDPSDVYSASKTEAEKALWAAVESTKPPFQVAAVLPSVNYGTRFRETGNSTADWVIGTYTGKDRSCRTSRRSTSST
jgi:nucleoside-diphosphate-sugar epimerase